MEKVAEEKPKLSERERKLKYYRDKYGDNIPDSLKPTVYYLENPPQKIFRPNKSKFEFLKHRSERTLAEVLTVRPGTLILRQPTFDSRFDEDFQSAAIDRIEIKDDDSEEVREIKKAVQDTKDEMIARVKEGEKASDIMNAEGKSLYELGMYRHELQREVGKASNNPDLSDADVKDFVAAANRMLEAKGAEPLRSSNFTYRQMSLAAAAERRKAAGKTEKKEDEK